MKKYRILFLEEDQDGSLEKRSMNVVAESTDEAVDNFLMESYKEELHFISIEEIK